MAIFYKTKLSPKFGTVRIKGLDTNDHRQITANLQIQMGNTTFPGKLVMVHYKTGQYSGRLGNAYKRLQLDATTKFLSE